MGILDDLFALPNQGTNRPQAADLPAQAPGFWGKMAQTWPARLAKDAYSAVTLPGDVYQGNVAMPTLGQRREDYTDIPTPSKGDARGTPGLLPDAWTAPAAWQPGDPLYQRAADLGGLVMGGSYAAAPAMRDATGMGIRAYHASPYDFDKFSIGKIGVGEGSQLEGHGLYFAGSKDAVKPYQKMFTGDEYLHADGVPIPASMHGAREALKRNGFDVEKTIAEYRNTFGKRYEPDEFAELIAPLETMRGKAIEPRPLKASTYEVDINAKPSEMLDWNAPLSAQNGSPALRSLGREWGDEASSTTGKQLYEAFSQFPGQAPNPVLARDVLMDAGIPGIVHRNGNGRNFTVFDDSLIDILRKYGLAGLPAAGATAPIFLNGKEGT